MGLDEYTEEALADELGRRLERRLAGKCDYCGRPWEWVSCRFSDRHYDVRVVPVGPKWRHDAKCEARWVGGTDEQWADPSFSGYSECKCLWRTGIAKRRRARQFLTEVVAAPTFPHCYESMCKKGSGGRCYCSCKFCGSLGHLSVGVPSASGCTLDHSLQEDGICPGCGWVIGTIE